MTDITTTTLEEGLRSGQIGFFPQLRSIGDHEVPDFVGGFDRLWGEGSVELPWITVCPDCGAAVADRATHTDWHLANG